MPPGKSQRGFVFIYFLFLIPVLLAAAILVLFSYRLIEVYNSQQTLCRTHVLQAQQILGQKLKELLDLNPNAESLRNEEHLIRMEMVAAAGFPPVLAVLGTRLQINLTRQGFLRANQEKIIFSAKLQANSVLNALQQKASQFGQATSEKAKLLVIKKPPLAIAPNHEAVPFFEDLQVIKANWKFFTFRIVPSFIANGFSKKSILPNTIYGKCAATLIQKGKVWNPKLVRDR